VPAVPLAGLDPAPPADHASVSLIHKIGSVDASRCS